MGRRALFPAAVAVGLICSCSAGPQVPVGAQPTPEPSITALPVPTTELSSTSEGPSSVFVVSTDGVVMPNAELTPGDVYPDVTAADICDDHYTKSVRQPRFNAKVKAFSLYGLSIHARDAFEVDKLVPTSLGGTNSIENLWPQPYGGPAGAEVKNQTERQLRGLVCSNTITLAEAQDAVAADWWAAHHRYAGLPILPGSAGPEPWTPPAEESTAPYAVVNQGPCQVEGQVGYTEAKHIRFTCTMTDTGLRWSKRD